MLAPLDSRPGAFGFGIDCRLEDRQGGGEMSKTETAEVMFLGILKNWLE